MVIPPVWHRGYLRQQVIEFLAYFGLVDLLDHFRQQLCFRHMKTLWKVQQGILVQSLCSYVLGSNHRLFGVVGIRDPSNYAYDHFALRARLLQRPTRCHGGYLRGNITLPLILPPMVPLNLMDTKLQYLKVL